MVQTKGKILVYTGDGKGKTTAAVGLAARALGRDMKVIMLQFIKSPDRDYGDQMALTKLGCEVYQLGAGCTWTQSAETNRAALKTAWMKAKEVLQKDEYDVVILDELNIALRIEDFPIDDVIPLQEVLHALQTKPESMHVVITGRDAKQEIKEIADLVSVVAEEKHYYQKGVQAIYGVDY